MLTVGLSENREFTLRHELMSSLFASKTLQEQYRALLIMTLIGGSVAFLLVGALYLSLRITKFGYAILGLILMRSGGSLAMTIGMGLASLVTLVISLPILSAELLLKILRSMAWRIADYNKGAWAGMVLLLTVSLGLFEIYLEFYRN